MSTGSIFIIFGILKIENVIDFPSGFFLLETFQKKDVCFTYCSICSKVDAVIETDKTQLISLF